METRPELSRYVQKLLDDESWQTEIDGIRRIEKEFALSLLTYADREGMDLEVMYKRVLRMLKAGES